MSKYVVTLVSQDAPNSRWETTKLDSLKSFVEGVLAGRGEATDYVDAVVRVMLGFVKAHGNYEGDSIVIERKG